MLRIFVLKIAALMVLVGVAPETRSEASQLALQAKSGLGVFQDIQLPYHEIAGVRLDGTNTAFENTDHVGFPLGIELASELSYLKSYRVLSRLEFIHMTSLSGNPETSHTAYSRYGLGITNLKQFPDHPFPFGLGLGLHVRRTNFENISSKHYLDSLFPTLHIHVFFGETWYSECDISLASISSFGFSSDALPGGALKDTTSDLISLKLQLVHNLSTQADLRFGIEAESASVFIPTIAAYQDFGLNLPSYAQDERSYNLSTKIYSVGLVKKF
jgi:hypothetical protein